MVAVRLLGRAGLARASRRGARASLAVFILAAASSACGSAPDAVVASDAPLSPSGGTATPNAADERPAPSTTELHALDLVQNTRTPLLPTVETGGATPLGLHAFTANGRIHPHGKPTTRWFEYGKTTAYGSTTKEAALPPKLSAVYRESWDGATSTAGGWKAGLTGLDLKRMSPGRVGGSSFLRYATPGDIDVNHSDGIGNNELVHYLYCGAYETEETPTVALSGGDPDLRGAKISAWVRGNAWRPHGSEVFFWLQATPDMATAYDPDASRFSNWAFTGFTLTDALLAGGWQQVSYRLANDSRAWTYAGNWLLPDRPTYVYQPIDEALGHLNADLFHMLVFPSTVDEPEGSIDIDEIEITYRNRSVLTASNGGRLVSAPPGSDDPATLVDGHRHGEGHTWRSAPSPSGPLEIEYALARPVHVDAVQIHQSLTFPSKDVEVLVSADGVSYERLTAGALPSSSPLGPNGMFFLDTPAKRQALITDGLSTTPWRDVAATRVKIRILSGYQSERWGLDEIEIFGTGAVMETDDDWYEVNADVGALVATGGLVPGTTYHYRLAARNEDGVVYGDDRTFTVPATSKPLATTGALVRAANATAKVTGVIAPLGASTTYRYEYGETVDYGLVTEEEYAGVQLTARPAAAILTDLVPGRTYHYRLVATNASGTTKGADASFVAK